MNNEQLEAGKELAEKIEKTEETLQRWEKTQCFGVENMIQIQYPGIGGGTRSDWTAASPDTFTVVKALNIQYFTKKLADLKAEFSKL